MPDNSGWEWNTTGISRASGMLLSRSKFLPVRPCLAFMGLRHDRYASCPLPGFAEHTDYETKFPTNTERPSLPSGVCLATLPYSRFKVFFISPIPGPATFCLLRCIVSYNLPITVSGKCTPGPSGEKGGGKLTYTINREKGNSVKGYCESLSVFFVLQSLTSHMLSLAARLSSP
jgi:hypothetical protein